MIYQKLPPLQGRLKHRYMNNIGCPICPHLLSYYLSIKLSTLVPEKVAVSEENFCLELEDLLQVPKVV